MSQVICGEIYSGKETLKKLDELLTSTKNRIANYSQVLDISVQHEMAKFIRILAKARVLLVVNEDDSKKKNKCEVIAQVNSILDIVDTGIKALNDKPNLWMAQKLRYYAEFMLRNVPGVEKNWYTDPLDYFQHATKVPTKVLIGLIGGSIVYFLSTLLIGYCLLRQPSIRNIFQPIIAQDKSNSSLPSITLTPEQIIKKEEYRYNKNVLLILLVWLAGSTGSAMSILTRIQEYQNEEYEDTFLPYAIGVVKPFIGGVFGLFLLALLRAGVLPIIATEITSKVSGSIAIAFVAGFSERLVKDLISQTEDKFLSKEKAEVQGLPTKITLTPPTQEIDYDKECVLILTPPQKVDVTLDPKLGTINQGINFELTYKTPNKTDAKEVKEVNITVTTKTEPPQTATATVTLKSPVIQDSSPKITLTPPTQEIDYDQECVLTLTPPQTVDVTLEPNLGTITKQSDSEITYKAPTNDVAGEVTQVKINVTTKTKPPQTATAIVTFKSPETA